MCCFPLFYGWKPSSIVSTRARTVPGRIVGVRLRSPIGVSLAVMLAACSGSSVPPSTEGGCHATKFEERSLIVCRPSGAPALVLIVLHGRSQNADEMQQMTRIDQPATDAGLATVYANGVGGRWGDDTFTSTARPDGDLDVEYLDHLIVELQRRGIAKSASVGIVGFSNGASMALRYASQRPGNVRAAVAVAGQLPLDPATQPQGRVPVMVVQGDSDPIRPYETGVPATPARVDDSPTPTMSTPATIDAFVRLADAGTLARTTAQLNSDAGDGTTVTQQTWSDRDGIAATLYTVNGGGHTWPDAAMIPASFADYGRTSRDVDASELAVEFVDGVRL